MKPCAHQVDGHDCGKPAVCAIKVQEGKLSMLDQHDETMGRGVASKWIPVCAMHKDKYPDHEGFDL
jgi:hypothetical protein